MAEKVEENPLPSFLYVLMPLLSGGSVEGKLTILHIMERKTGQLMKLSPE
ncbi:hypothetical protein CHCC14820_3613 [Bacillus paralicheniformis]|nr:hypothetical protein B4123_0471 [Bacillus paralicheniformis]TWJ52204.1 hypothetical protein CHCC5023_4325 [Bacillus paralicheniformis]TWJ66346.1 hypothetical protein CHCC5021_0622 [Bacillus paralicheniformis]TWJ70773.1 hypothetical protein CHCC5019_3834 [Bacillus paralicheniformis]TWK44250.1 hypothetical protein CHCC20347_3700 [Bacillus paralicheniformis]